MCFSFRKIAKIVKCCEIGLLTLGQEHSVLSKVCQLGMGKEEFRGLVSTPSGEVYAKVLRFTYSILLI